MLVKKLLILLTFSLILSTSLSAGTWALFIDNETSSADQVASGTLDLKTDDIDGVSQTLYDTAIVPGNGVGPSTIVLKNAGSTDGSTLDIDVSYVNSDGVPNIVDMTANETAAIFKVTTLTYDSTDLLQIVSNNNGNEYKDIQDVADTDLSGQSGLAAGTSKDFTIEITTDNATSTDYANDGITVTINFTLNQ